LKLLFLTQQKIESCLADKMVSRNQDETPFWQNSKWRESSTRARAKAKAKETYCSSNPKTSYETTGQ
jgi:hypothetical protein